MLVQIYMLCFVILTWLFAASAEGPFFSFRCITYRFVIAVLLRFIISNKLIITYNHLGPVWYMCLKTENCCLKIFVKIRVGEKVH